MSMWSMPFGLIRTLQDVSLPSLKMLVSFLKHCRRSCSKFTGELSTCSGAGRGGSGSGCGTYEILPQPELHSGLCRVDDARSESSLLQRCHQSWLHAGGYHPGACHPSCKSFISRLGQFHGFLPRGGLPQKPDEAQKYCYGPRVQVFLPDQLLTQRPHVNIGRSRRNL